MSSRATTLPDFNPSKDENVTAIKAMTEQLLMFIEQLPDGVMDPRRRAIALTNYEQAAMWAVKALFTND